MLTDVPDLIGVRVGSLFAISDHSAISINTVLEQSIPHEMCRQEVYLKNHAD